MAAARIAAVLLIALAPLACAQENSQSVVTVQVTDVTGAPIPGAQVDIGPECTGSVGGETDQKGEISLDQRPGPWDNTLTVTSQGFCPEARTIQVQDRPAQLIPVKMQVGGCPSKCTPICVTVESTEVQKTEVQKSAQGRIAVLVEDTAGGYVPGAKIEVDPSSPSHGPILMTDDKGRASFDLPGGIHTFAVTELGFEKWTHRIEVPNAVGRTIEAMLRVKALCDVALFNPSPDIRLGIPEPLFIPLQPLLNLDPLPSRQAKKRW
jgi:hypothetical protein